MTYRLCLIGYGKIARDQHEPVIDAHPDFELDCIVSRSITHPKQPSYISLDQALVDRPDIDAVILCTPPTPRAHLAKEAMKAGKAVFLEKPPALTVSEAEALNEAAFESGSTLFASWHSRFAPYVEQARAWAARRVLKDVSIQWREDVLKWHPGQDWLWQPGGMGVFDPGINALSILTEILPTSVALEAANLFYPENKNQPIAANLRLSGDEWTGQAAFDFRESGVEIWQISLTDTDGEILTLSEGGAALQIGDAKYPPLQEKEYRGLYDRFAELLKDGVSEMDLRPLQLVADAFLCGTKQTVAAFYDPAAKPK